jgi:hypothetical protein
MKNQAANRRTFPGKFGLDVHRELEKLGTLLECGIHRLGCDSMPGQIDKSNSFKGGDNLDSCVFLLF